MERQSPDRDKTSLLSLISTKPGGARIGADSSSGDKWEIVEPHDCKASMESLVLGVLLGVDISYTSVPSAFVN